MHDIFYWGVERTPKVSVSVGLTASCICIIVLSITFHTKRCITCSNWLWLGLCNFSRDPSCMHLHLALASSFPKTDHIKVPMTYVCSICHLYSRIWLNDVFSGILGDILEFVYFSWTIQVPDDSSCTMEFIPILHPSPYQIWKEKPSW